MRSLGKTSLCQYFLMLQGAQGQPVQGEWKAAREAAGVLWVRSWRKTPNPVQQAPSSMPHHVDLAWFWLMGQHFRTAQLQIRVNYYVGTRCRHFARLHGRRCQNLRQVIVSASEATEPTVLGLSEIGRAAAAAAAACHCFRPDAVATQASCSKPFDCADPTCVSNRRAGQPQAPEAL